MASSGAAQPLGVSGGSAVTVWYAEPVDVPRLHPLLDARERLRYDTLTRPEDRARFATARVLARTLVTQLAGGAAAEVLLTPHCRQCGGDHGKPVVGAGATGLELSISHSDRRVVVAVAAGTPVGVDVEPVRALANAAPLADRVLAGSEHAAFAPISSEHRSRALLTYWVRKEALLKATGHGLNVALSALTMSRPDELPRLLRWDGPEPGPAVTALADVEVGLGYVACVATLVAGPLQVHVADATHALDRTVRG